jgi:hypothetical protein
MVTSSCAEGAGRTTGQIWFLGTMCVGYLPLIGAFVAGVTCGEYLQILPPLRLLFWAGFPSSATGAVWEWQFHELWI